MKTLKNLSKRGLAFTLVMMMCLGLVNGAIFAADDEGEEQSEANVEIITINEQGEEPGDQTEEGAELPEEWETPEADGSDEWDISDTKRPEASEDVTADVGTAEDKVTDQDKNWDIFYDADKDVYKITFNIGENAEGTQVIDLTQALELLGQYADSGKQELEEAIKALEKPVKGEAGDEPVMAELPEEPAEPEAPVDFDMEKPEGPGAAPVEPGKPEGMDEALDGAWDKLFDDLSGEGNADNTPEHILAEMANLGIDTSDKYVQDYAQYMVKKADNAFSIKVIETRGEIGGEGIFKYLMMWESSYNGRGEPTDEQIAQAIASVQRQDDRLTAPEYEVDKNSEAYKAYEAAKAEYEANMADYEAALGEYNAALDAYLKEHGPDSEEGKAYAEALAEYTALKAEYETKIAEIQAEYEAAVSDYQAKLADIEKQYADDQAAYDAAVKALKADFDRRIGADVLEPGDVKKFELFITSDSKHTYKYQTGSFTLATPSWTVNPDGTVTGFDGQILPDEYVDHHDYYVTVRSEPIQKMLETIGMDQYDRFNGSWPSYWNSDINDFLSQYPGETNADRLNSYILSYYGNEYATIDELIKNNPDAMKELTKTETSGNKWFRLDGQYVKVDAHLETVKYDQFYKQLFSFAFGDEADLDKILGEMKFNAGTNRWEYENDSWTNNGYQNALYYYMDHKEIWQKTDAYFNALLDGGLSAEQATWTSLMMALNIDGELTGNDWQNTKWPWYSSIQLERVDIDLDLSKKDGETGEIITGSETEFQVYYIDKVKSEDGTESEVKMYCTYDTDKNTYTFVSTESTVWTKDGQLKIDYAMMKDIVYYLQEMTAPEGYERDTNVYIVMDEKDYDQLSDEDKANLEGTFDKFLDLEKSDDGLSLSTDFVNVKIVTPGPNPDEPNTPNTPDDPDEPDEPNPPEEPEIPDDDVPLTPGPGPETPVPETPDEEIDLPDPEVPLAEMPETPEEEEIPEEDVPLADVPKTGDTTAFWALLTLVSGAGMALVGRKNEEEAR